MSKKKTANTPKPKNSSSVADAAFKKKVTAIFGSILLVFIIGVAVVLLNAWNNGSRQYDIFVEEAQRAQELSLKRKAGENVEGIDIELNEKNYYYWISAIDESYQADNDSPDYGIYDGCTIHLQGIFRIKEYVDGKYINYWVVRTYEHEHEGEEHGEHEEAAAHEEELPIEVMFDGDIPKDGDWVDVTGVVAVDSTGSLSAVKDATVTVIDAQDPHID